MILQMQKYPTAKFGISSRFLQEDDPFPVFVDVKESLRRHFFKDGFLDIGPTGVIIDRDIFNLVGGFSGKRMIGDIELWLIIAMRYPLLVLSPSSYYWRKHEGQEFNFGLKNYYYIEDKMLVVFKTLLDENCNLDFIEKEKIRMQYRKAALRNLISLGVRERKLKQSITIAKNLGLKFIDLISLFKVIILFSYINYLFS
jgi:hypothetical protein